MIEGFIGSNRRSSKPTIETKAGLGNSDARIGRQCRQLQEGKVTVSLRYSGKANHGTSETVVNSNQDNKRVTSAREGHYEGYARIEGQTGQIVERSGCTAG